jgi:arginyl-tRNA synthetase
MKKDQHFPLNIQKKLQEIFKIAIRDSFNLETVIEVVRSKAPLPSDYQSPVAMVLAKQLQKNPQQLAKEIVSSIQHPMIDRLEVAGPGFINIFLKQDYLENGAANLFHPLPKNSKTVLVDYSSPNVAKELHVGHLRSTIIGDSLANLFEYLGYDVLRVNHIGDFGTQFGMLLTYITDQDLNPAEASLPDLMEWYRKSKTLFDADPDFKKRSQEMVVSLQAKEAKIDNLWEQILDVSRKGFQEIYNILNVHLIERGESFYQPYLKLIVELFEKNRLVTISQGAKCVFLEGYKDPDGNLLPLIIQKSDGGYNYATTDLAALKYRIEHDKVQRIVYVTDLGQSQHLHMVFDAAKLCGYYDPNTVEVQHAGFGLVLGSDGTKMKTRSGEVFRLIDLIKEAIYKSRQILNERYEGTLKDEELDQMALVLGVNAIKYADLSTVRTKDYSFSFDRMLRFEGNTAAFNLYSYVRILSILRKTNQKASAIKIVHPTERKLLLHLYHLHEVIDAVSRDLMPHRVADYMYSLAEIFNEFFRDCRVEGSENEQSRIALLQLTKRAFEICFTILGLRTLERM